MVPGMCPGLEEWWLKQTEDVVFYLHLHTLEMILYCLLLLPNSCVLLQKIIVVKI